MMVPFIPPPSGCFTAAGHRQLLPARGAEKQPRAAFSRSARRAAMAVAMAGLLPLSSFAARHSRGSGGSNGGAHVSALTCSQSSLSGTASDSCTVTLSAAAGSQGTSVSLSSNKAAVVAPASVVIPQGATAASFTVDASAVTASESATLTASEGGTSETFVLTLKAKAAGTAALTVNAAQVAFGNVTDNSPATQAVTLTSSGTAALTVESATVAGKGFSATGVNFPITLNPKQSATLEVQFDPTTTGAASGTVTIDSNASSGSAVTISLTGTGATSSSYAVKLSWKAPASSPDAVVGYNIYRATGSGSYELMNTSVNAPITYSDATAQSGTTYSYKVMSVDTSGVESTASNVYTATLP
ncbi:MAG TPA: choice-of-anchor D domain-containing protein [Acidobacteriaceae bacterium]|jgi:hypothetical protein|nr:choice-of-anchor D domain-containing protein [Acidobacteriaceae bacterium]